MLYGLPIAVATGAIGADTVQENVMKTEKLSFVKEALGLLREVRQGMHDESNRDLVASLDEALAILEAALLEGSDNTDHVTKALKTIGHGLAALSWIQRIIDKMND